MVNLASKKREGIITGGKDSSVIRSDIGKATGMVADVPTLDSLGKRYGAFG